MGERITAARAARGLTQGDLSRESGIAATQLSRYETGRASPRKLALARLAGALAVSLEWLESGSGQMDEYPGAAGASMVFALDPEIANRLAAYAHYNELSVTEALADILDAPLSAYSERELPTDKAAQDNLRKMLRAYQKGRTRTLTLAKQVKLLGSL